MEKFIIVDNFWPLIYITLVESMDPVNLSLAVTEFNHRPVRTALMESPTELRAKGRGYIKHERELIAIFYNSLPALLTEIVSNGSKIIDIANTKLYHLLKIKIKRL